MGGTPIRVETDAEEPARCRAQAVVGWLSVDQETNAVRWALVRDTRAVAAPLFAGNKQQCNPRLSSRAQRFGSGDLRRQDPFRITRAAPEQQSPLFPARKERWHAVEMGREDDFRGRVETRVDVETPVYNRLLGDLIAKLLKGSGQYSSGLRFAPRR